jgi:hypothetical protein
LQPIAAHRPFVENQTHAHVLSPLITGPLCGFGDDEARMCSVGAWLLNFNAHGGADGAN